MTEQTDFWLQLHQLAGTYKAMGTTPDEREAALTFQFRANAAKAKQEAADEMLTMAAALGNLYSRAVT